MMWMLEKYLQIMLSQKRIEKHLRTLKIHPAEKASAAIMVSAVQREIKPVKRVEDYIDMIRDYVMEAALRGSELVAFPEYNSFDLLGIIPGFKAMEDKIASENDGEADKRSLYSLLYSAADSMESCLKTIMCSLAEKYGIYIYTGSYLLKEDGKLYNAGSLISREGKILGTQKKLHLTEFEAALGISRGSSLEVFDTDIGKIACPICMDGSYFEIFRLLNDKGCDIAILPIANMEEYNLYKSIRGAWLRAQESCMYIVKPSLNGSLAGMLFTGKAGIYAPLEATDGLGAVIYTEEFKGSRVIHASLDMDGLHRARANAEYFGDRNEVFEKGYFERTYGTLVRSAQSAIRNC